MIQVGKQLNSSDKMVPLLWETEHVYNQDMPKEQTYLFVRFHGEVGIKGFTRVGIYRDELSLNTISCHCSHTSSCPNCGGVVCISASGVSEGVCLACRTAFGSDPEAVIRAEQCFWACEEAGIVDAWDLKHNPAKSPAYFVV